MNIKIVDSWLREYLDTKATSSEISKILSLTSVSVDRFENSTYDIEVTTNRPYLMSVVSLAREAATVLSEHGIAARFKNPALAQIPSTQTKFPLEIRNDPSLVNRICAVVMEVSIGKSPKEISDRLESSGIRSLNNLVDVTNYVMREIGHPAHVFDFDNLAQKLTVRQSRKGEEIVTLDGKKYRLYGGDIVLDDGRGQIVDLLGVMGTQNSAVREDSKRILFFIDNNNPRRIRNTSMTLGIRTEAAILNEKGIDPNLAMTALKRGVELYQKIAQGKVISQVLDIYPNKPSVSTVKVDTKKVNLVVGVEISASKQAEILEKLGFEVKREGDGLIVGTPTQRPDVLIEEDVIEEISRVYGYEKLPSVIPTFLSENKYEYSDIFYFERRVKEALKYWGFTEVYTYSLVSEDLFQGPIESAIKLKNPLSVDMMYLRNSLIPSLLEVAGENKTISELKIFELANVYLKKNKDLPIEKLILSGLMSKPKASFYELKGIVESLLQDLGITELKFRQKRDGIGAEVLINTQICGNIEVLNSEIVYFELDFELILKHATLKRKYQSIAKYPAITQDLTLVSEASTEQITEVIKAQNQLIESVILKDTFETARTFQITYQSMDKNLTKEEVKEVREKIISVLEKELNAVIK